MVFFTLRLDYGDLINRISAQIFFLRIQKNNSVIILEIDKIDRNCLLAYPISSMIKSVA